MRILLGVVPQSDVASHPLLAIPALSAYLARSGYESVERRDFAVDVDEWFTRRETVDWAYERVLATRDRLKRSAGFEEERAEWYTRLELTAATYPAIVQALERARDIWFHEPKLEHIQENVRWANKVILLAYRLIGAAHHPTKVEPKTLGMKYDVHVSQDILDATEDAETNPYIEAYRHAVLPQIAANEFDLIGMSGMFFDQIIPAFTLARLLREHSPRSHIVLGGGAVSMLFKGTRPINPDLFRTIDSILLLEGEEPLLQLVRALERDAGTPGPSPRAAGSNLLGAPPADRLEGVASRIYLGRDGTVHRNPIAESNLRDLPTPDFGILRPKPHYQPATRLPFEVSRGCYFKRCTFCNCYKSLRDDYDVMSADVALDHVEELVRRHGVRHFMFTDDVVAPSFLKAFARRVLERGVAITWENNARFEKMFDFELCSLLYLAGCRYLKFGLESGNQRVLDFMDKGTTLQTIEQVLDACHRSGIRVHTYVMMGIPTETLEEMEETIEFLKRNWERIDSFYLAHFQLQDHTPMMGNPAAFHMTNIRPPARQDLPLEFEYDAAGMSRVESRQFVVTASTELQRWYYEDRGFRPASRPTLPRRDPTITNEVVPTFCPSIRMTTLRRDLVQRPVAGSGTSNGSEVRALFNAERHIMKGVNEVGAFVFELCDGVKTLGDIVEMTAEHFEVSASDIADDVYDFYEELLGMGHMFEGPYLKKSTVGEHFVLSGA